MFFFNIAYGYRIWYMKLKICFMQWYIFCRSIYSLKLRYLHESSLLELKQPTKWDLRQYLMDSNIPGIKLCRWMCIKRQYEQSSIVYLELSFMHQKLSLLPNCRDLLLTYLWLLLAKYLVDFCRVCIFSQIKWTNLRLTIEVLKYNHRSI